MRVTGAQLQAQFNLATQEGWWRHLEDAAAAYFPNGEFDAVDLFAIGSRETNWNRKYLTEPGDNGNGYGPMQVDKRSYPSWVASGRWRLPREAIMKGAEVLQHHMNDARANTGRAFSVRDRKGKTYTIPKGAPMNREELRRVALAAYNSGRWSYYHFSKGRDPDRGTTGADYGKDVLERAAAARAWAPAGDRARRIPVEAEKTCPTCGGTGKVPA